MIGKTNLSDELVDDDQIMWSADIKRPRRTIKCSYETLRLGDIPDALSKRLNEICNIKRICVYSAFAVTFASKVFIKIIEYFLLCSI